MGRKDRFFSNDEVIDMVSMYANGDSLIDISNKYGTALSTVSDIINRKKYKDVCVKMTVKEMKLSHYSAVEDFRFSLKSQMNEEKNKQKLKLKQERERTYNLKIKQDDLREISRLLGEGVSTELLASQFSLSRQTIRRILTMERYAKNLALIGIDVNEIKERRKKSNSNVVCRHSSVVGAKPISIYEIEAPYLYESSYRKFVGMVNELDSVLPTICKYINDIGKKIKSVSGIIDENMGGLHVNVDIYQSGRGGLGKLCFDFDNLGDWNDKSN